MGNKRRSWAISLGMALLFAALLPTQGFSTPLTQSETFYFSTFGQSTLAQLDVTVYGPDLGDPTGFALKAGEYLYQYQIKNIDGTFLPNTILQFMLDVTKGVEVSQIGPIPASNISVGDYIIFSGLAIAEGASMSLYIVSPGAPELVTAEFVSALGGTGSAGPKVWAPDPPPSTSIPVPEPATLVLIGSGLLGLAGLIRKIRKKG
jgi:hypothetical protein